MLALKVARRTEKQQQTMSGYVLGAGRSVKERETERESEEQDTNRRWCRYTVLAVMVVTMVLGAVFWRVAPKEDRTVWRSTVSLVLAMMFLMWAFTYLCQLHPLVAPRRSDLRPEYAE